MQRSLVSSCLFTFAALALAACGDDGGSTPVDASPADAPPVCELAGYPASVRPLSVDLQAPVQLTLDGNGSRCDQLVRALTGAGRPAELAQMDVGDAIGQCSFDDVTGRDIVRLRLPEYGGVPVFWPVQDVLAHVDARDSVVFLHGDFLPTGHTPVAGCLDATALAARIPGQPLGYEKFAACTPRGAGEYTIAAGDVVEPVEEGVYLDGDGGLRRVHAFDVYLAPEHVDSEITNSDAYCCSGPSLERCVGKRIFLDALTGETIATEPHCHIC